MRHPSTQWAYKGSTNQEQKSQESRKSRKEENDWLRKVANQSNKVLKKNSLRSSMDLSLSSKHLLFLSFKDTTLSNGEQLTKYNHFDDDQTCLANMLGDLKRIVA